MSSQTTGNETVLILRVREDHLPRVLDALKDVDSGVTDEVSGFALGSRMTGRVKMTTVFDGARSDTCTGDLQ
jgi:hypothetical protein